MNNRYKLISARQGNVLPDYDDNVLVGPNNIILRDIVNNGALFGDRYTLDFQFDRKYQTNAGLLKNIEKNNHIIKALNNPILYLKEKNDDMQRIGKYVSDYITKEYVQFVNRGYDDKTSMKKAKESGDIILKREIENHNIRYPESLVKRAMGF